MYGRNGGFAKVKKGVDNMEMIPEILTDLPFLPIKKLMEVQRLY